MPRLLLAAVLLTLVCPAVADEVRSAASPPTDRRTTLYPSNREPLAPSPFVRLPIGAVQPKGWLAHQLDLLRDGMTGRLPEVSQWCQFGGNAWSDPKGKGHSGWEEMPYWLKGFGDLGLVTKDPRILQEARRWIDAIFATQKDDGWFGPEGLRTSLDGKPDLWPNMVVLNCLQSWHEATGDERIIPFMTRYFRWQLQVPEKDFLVGYWPKMRGGDNLESICWLYNRTGDKWLLELAAKVHRHTADWSKGVINPHGVNISQGFREPTLFWVLSGNPQHRAGAERNYQEVMGAYGQFPGGGFASDENCRPGYRDPRQGFETCSIVEFMHSFEMLTRTTGETVWADRCEELAFNTFPASMTPSLKALHYLTGANMVQLDRKNKAPGIQNGGTMLSFSPGAVYRCCQHNVSHGWPYYAEECWLATSDAGLAASLYVPCTVTAKVADGKTVSLAETTDYPFADTVTFKVSAAAPVAFPLYLRVPGWSGPPELRLNGQPLPAAAKPGSYLVVTRTWKDGDTLSLRLPMRLTTTTWTRNKNAVSVSYGPLTFSLKIGEKWSRYGGSDAWPEQEVFPTTPFNYGLVLAAKPESTFRLSRREGLLPANPFTPESVPLSLTAKGRRIPNWMLDSNGLLNPLQDSPVKSTEPEEEISLIPMGAARLRITAFPVIGTGPDARDWTSAPRIPTASHCFESDTPAALNDGLLPRSSNDHDLPRFTWYPRKGTTEWVQYDFDKPRRLAATEAYWFDDEPKGQCRVPASWRLLVKVGDRWQEVQGASAYGVARDRFNRLTFNPVETTAVRLEARLRPGQSAGILEWKVE